MKRNKILALIAGAAILFGIVCSAIIIIQGIQTASLNPQTAKGRYPQAWDLEKTELEEFSEISVNLSYCSLSILPSDGYYLEYHMDGTCEEPEYEISGDSFRFQEGYTQIKYRTGIHLFFNPGSFSSNQEPYYVNLYVPKNKYFDLLSLSDESGNIEIGSIQAEDAEIFAEYGNLEMKDFSGKKLSINADSGNIELDTVICDALDISNEYGNVSADSFEIAEHTTISLDSGSLTLSKLKSEQLTLSNEYGNCTIDEITVKSSDISMDSGALKLRQAVLGSTEIHNSYGNITLNLANDISDYNYDLNAEYGTIKLDGKQIEPDEDGEVYYQKDNGQENDILINCESGNIEIR